MNLLSQELARARHEHRVSDAVSRHRREAARAAHRAVDRTAEPWEPGGVFIAVEGEPSVQAGLVGTPVYAGIQGPRLGVPGTGREAGAVETAVAGTDSWVRYSVGYSIDTLLRLAKESKSITSDRTSRQESVPARL